jgi:hypothetical protein
MHKRRELNYFFVSNILNGLKVVILSTTMIN